MRSSVSAETHGFVWIVDLIDMIESEASCELYGLLKRPDEKFVTEVAGYPTVFAHGMLTMGMTGMLLTNYVGDGRLTKYGVRFVNQVWPGDTLTGTAEVVEIREEDGAHLVDLKLTTVNQDDTPVLTGTATARIDS